MSNQHAVEIARKKLAATAYEIAAKYGVEIHSVHFSVVTSEDDPKPHVSARMCYTDTSDEQVTTVRE
jgi:hypothetical protein